MNTISLTLTIRAVKWWFRALLFETRVYVNTCWPGTPYIGQTGLTRKSPCLYFCWDLRCVPPHTVISLCVWCYVHVCMYMHTCACMHTSINSRMLKEYIGFIYFLPYFLETSLLMNLELGCQPACPNYYLYHPYTTLGLHECSQHLVFIRGFEFRSLRQALSFPEPSPQHPLYTSFKCHL